MLETSHHYESVEMDVMDDDAPDHEEEDHEASGTVEKVPKKPKKRTRRRRAPPPKHGNGTSCASFVCAFILALLVIVVVLGIGIYILQQKGYHLESSGTTATGSDADNKYSWLRGSTTPHHNSQPIDVYKAGTTDENENGNDSDSSTTGSTSRSKGHNIEESTAEHPHEGLPLPATSHLSITSTSHVPGVNVAVASQPNPTTKGVVPGGGTDNDIKPDATTDVNKDSHSQVTPKPVPSNPEVKTPAPNEDNQQQQPTGSKATPDVFMADDDLLWQTQVAEKHTATTLKEPTKSDHASSGAATDPKSDTNSIPSNEPQADNVKQEETEGTGESKSDSDAEHVNSDGEKQSKTQEPTKVVGEIGDDDALWKVTKPGNDPPP